MTAEGQSSGSKVNTMRLNIIGDELFEIVGESHSCMVYKLPIIVKQTRKCECEKVVARVV